MSEEETTRVRRLECPNCGGEMYATDPDRYCLGCIHEGRV